MFENLLDLFNNWLFFKEFFLSFAQLFFLLSDCFEYYDTRLDFLAGKYIVEVKTSISSIPFDLVLLLLDVKISW